MKASDVKELCQARIYQRKPRKQIPSIFIRPKGSAHIKFEFPPGQYVLNVAYTLKMRNPFLDILRKTLTKAKNKDFKKDVKDAIKRHESEFPYHITRSWDWDFFVDDKNKLHFETGGKLTSSTDVIYSKNQLKNIGINKVIDGFMDMDPRKVVGWKKIEHVVESAPKTTGSTANVDIKVLFDSRPINSFQANITVSQKLKEAKKPTFQPETILYGPFITNKPGCYVLDKKEQKNVKGSKNQAYIENLAKQNSKTREYLVHCYRNSIKPAIMPVATIHGYADTRGSEGKNKGLSINRAKSVQELLRNEFGGKLEWYEPRGFGERKKDKGKTEGKDEPNNRVVIIKIQLLK